MIGAVTLATDAVHTPTPLVYALVLLIRSNVETHVFIVLCDGGAVPVVNALAVVISDKEATALTATFVVVVTTLEKVDVTTWEVEVTAVVTKEGIAATRDRTTGTALETKC